MENTETLVPFQRRIPWLTFVLIGICVVLYIALNLFAKSDDLHDYNMLGMFFISNLRDGNYLGILTNNFVHLDWWHILFNMYGLFILGGLIEHEDGWPFMLFLTITSGIVASAVQVIVADNLGIGFSGVIYGYLGYIWIMGRYGGRENYKLEPGMVSQFIGWLLLCIVLTKLNVMHIANGAHAGGLLFGCGLAFARFKRDVFLTTGFVLCCLLVMVPVFWAPWSLSAMEHKAGKLHNSQQFEKAIAAYQEILDKDPDNEFAANNKNRIETYQLSQAAMQAHNTQQIAQADSLYGEILKRDPDDVWAKAGKKQMEIHLLSQAAYQAQTALDSLRADSLYNQILLRDSVNVWAKENKALLMGK